MKEKFLEFYKSLNPDQRKTFFFALAVAVALVFLIMPRLPHFGSGKSSSPPKPICCAPPVVTASQRTPQAAPPALPTAIAVGRWKGSGPVGDRGICTLFLEVAPTKEDGRFSGASNFACVPLTDAQKANAGPGLTLGVRNNAALALMLGKITPTSLILSGTQEGNALKLHVDESAAAPAACGMTDMTVEAFGSRAVLVKWSEQGCAGGSMTLAKVG